MLRITLHDQPQLLTLQLEGKLAGPWVRELEKSWQAALLGQPKRVVRLDLTAVTFIDAAGKQALAGMHAQGARFAVAGCLMRAIVAEITRAPVPDHVRPEKTND